jgi:hypothetical protein
LQSAHELLLFVWALVYGLLAVWLERWFVMPAVACCVSFLVACAVPDALYVLMTACNLVFTFVIVKFWGPREEFEKIRQRRAAIHEQAKRWLRPEGRANGVGRK